MTRETPRKVLLLALGDDYWIPFVIDLARRLRSKGTPYVIAVDSRAGEYQSFGRRMAPQMGTVYYFSDYRRQLDRGALKPVAARVLFSDYFRLYALGAHRQIECTDWVSLSGELAHFFTDLFRREDIGVVVHDQVSTSFSYVCYEIATEFGIPYMGLVGARVPGRYEIRSSIYQEHEPLHRRYRSIVEGIAPLTAEEGRWADEYLRSIDEQEPAYMKGNALNDARWHRYVNRRKLASFLRKCWYEIRERSEARQFTFRDTPVAGSLRSVTRNLARLYHRRRFSAFETSLSSTWLSSSKFVIYPIHYQPEASTSIGSPHHVDQESVIRNIAFSLPPDLSLVVKEHRSAIGYNTTRFYRSVAALPGVFLVGPHLNIKSLIRLSQGVVALTSTAAFEAALLGKRAWLLGHAPFQCHPLITRVSSFEELSSSLAARNADLPSYDNRAFLVAYRRSTRSGSITYSEECWGIGDDLICAIRDKLAEANDRAPSSEPSLGPT
jgi:hypothetical protein